MLILPGLFTGRSMLDSSRVEKVSSVMAI